MASESKIGSFVGTGAALTIALGFVPDHVKVMNETDGDTTFDWFNGMDEGATLTSSATGDNSKINADGITAWPGDRATPEGFTAGTAVSETGKTFRYIATRNGEY